MPKLEIKPLFVRLSEAERRRIRTLAVSQGLTTREAIIQAFEVWAKHLRSGAHSTGKQGDPGAAQRRTSGREPDGRHQPRYSSTGRQVGRPAAPGPSEADSAPGDVASLPGLGALTGDWPARAARLDWSKCPAAESVQTKRGTIWVAAETLHPLIDVFEAVSQGHPLTEIAEVYGLSPQQLMTLLQFAAENAAP